jgi:hypothetical protein
VETKNLEYEKIYKKAYKKVFKAHFHGLTFSEDEELKVPKNYKDLQKKGVDKLKIKILKEGITGLEGRYWKMNIRGKKFAKLCSGVKKENFWCYLELNPSKILYGNNIRNVRDPIHLRKALGLAFKEISGYGYEIDSSLCELESIEVNEMLILDHDDTNEKTFGIITDEISKGNFKVKSGLYKQSAIPNAFTMGTKNSMVNGYDKTLEVIDREFKEAKKTPPPMAEMRKIAKKYKTFFRLEATRGSASLKNLIGSEKIKLDYFLENSEEVIDVVFDKTIESAGLTEERVGEVNLKKVKRLALTLKRYIRMYQRNFTIKFLKDYQSQIWGEQQLILLIEHIGGSRQTRYDRKISFKKSYKQIKDKRNTNLDSFQHLRKVVESI